ncbi:hypothetical protein FOPG_12125 [Fusarium oxysporum f. sp. conglutinans race 2 54008]|uniref:Uncharacterized protein n=1 Tax=Fusarium oxysporum f. sp. conglutinans race 2 54008 TaxID=1089457 RepID=X0H8C3_FUSOX|nr:hypothetical protein FOPG_12125 [Fusarium oxysporum f. sp. conglutinans race 2 54008]
MNEANEVGACWVDGLAGAEKVEAVWRPAHEVAESTAEAVGQVVQSASLLHCASDLFIGKMGHAMSRCLRKAMDNASVSLACR